MQKGGIPISEFSGSGATMAMHATLKTFITQSERQTDKLIKLTWAIVALTVVLVIGLAIQLWLAAQGCQL